MFSTKSTIPTYVRMYMDSTAYVVCTYIQYICVMYTYMNDQYCLHRYPIHAYVCMYVCK